MKSNLYNRLQLNTVTKALTVALIMEQVNEEINQLVNTLIGDMIEIINALNLKIINKKVIEKIFKIIENEEISNRLIDSVQYCINKRYESAKLE
jgi:predicted ATP-dependent serine protease